MSAWIGLVPKQFSKGGKQVLLGGGDTYLGRLLVHVARAVLGHIKQQPKSYPHRWLYDLLKRKHKNVAIVALANRNARIAWPLLANQQDYKPE